MGFLEMRQRNFSTTRKHVVAPGQSVLVELDLLGSEEPLEIYERPLPGSDIEFIRPDAFIYTAPDGRWPRDGFILRLPNGDYDHFAILIDDDYERTPAQLAAMRLPSGSFDGAERLAELETIVAGVRALVGAE